MVVASDERSAAGGITNVVRSVGMAAAPLLLGYLAAAPPTSLRFSSPWLISGGVKILYDVGLYATYRLSSMRGDEAGAEGAGQGGEPQPQPGEPTRRCDSDAAAPSGRA